MWKTKYWRAHSCKWVVYVAYAIVETKYIARVNGKGDDGMAGDDGDKGEWKWGCIWGEEDV